MKNFKWLMMLVASIMVFAVSCDDQPAPEPGPGPDPTPKPSLEDVTFDVKINSTTKTTMNFSVTPSNLEANYFCTVMDVASVDDYPMDQYLVSALYDEITEEGYAIGERFDEYMPLMLDKGIIEGTFKGLATSTDYYLVIFVVDPDNNYRFVGEVVKTPFKTTAPEMVECDFEVTPTVTNTVATIKVIPTDATLRWHLIVYPKEGLDSYLTGENAMSLDYFYQLYFNNEINQYLGAGYPEDQVIAQLMPMGSQTVKVERLVANEEYSYLIAGITLDGDGAWVSTEVSRGSFTAGDVVPSTNSFDLSVSNITALKVDTVVTTANKDPYCVLLDVYDGESTAEEVMAEVVKNYGNFMNQGYMLYSGNQSFTVKLDAPGLKYYLIAFGYNMGVTTAPTMITFEAPEGDDPATAVYTMEGSNPTPYTANVSVSAESDNVYYTVNIVEPDLFDAEAVLEEEKEAMDNMIEAYKEVDPTMTPAKILSTYYSRGTPSQPFTASGLTPETEYMGYAVTFDPKTGYPVRVIEFPNLVATTALGSVSPTVEWMGCFSGDEEAGTIFGSKSATQGRAIAVIKYDNFEGARKLQTTSVAGDVSNPADMSDTVLWGLTMGEWVACKQTSPYSFYLCNWNEDMTALAYCSDTSGLPGSIGRAWFKATALDKKPVSELKALYDLANAKDKASVVAPSSLVIGDAVADVKPTLSPAVFESVVEEAPVAVAKPAAVEEMAVEESTISHINILERLPRFHFRR